MTTLSCPKCAATIHPSVLREDIPYSCPTCGVLQHSEVFPAFFEDVEKGRAPELAVMEEDSRCFNHSDKIAVVPCSICGIYLCDLCDIQADGSHFCPKCFKDRKKDIKSFATGAFMYDEFLLALALLPVIFPPMTLVTAPAVLVMAFVTRGKWDNTPYVRAHWRCYLAVIFAFFELAMWAFVFLSIIFGSN